MRQFIARLILCGALGVAGTTAVPARAQQEAPIPVPLALPDASSHQGVVDESWIIAPRNLPHATLAAVKNYADEGDLAAGVSLRYRIPGADWIIADVFIYPAGQGDTKRMLKQAVEDFRESIAYAERQSIYRNIWWGQEEDYATPLTGGDKLAGRFLPLVFDAQNDMLTSRTYLFYRKLYFLKIRLTTTVDAVDSLSDMADGFIRDVVNGVDIVSVGTCGRSFDLQVLAPGQSLPSDMSDGVSPEGFRAMLKTQPGSASYATQLSKALALAGKRQRAQGCTSLDYHPPADDPTHAVLHLRFGPNDWGAAPRQ